MVETNWISYVITLKSKVFVSKMRSCCYYKTPHSSFSAQLALSMNLLNSANSTKTIMHKLEGSFYHTCLDSIMLIKLAFNWRDPWIESFWPHFMSSNSMDSSKIYCGKTRFHIWIIYAGGTATFSALSVLHRSSTLPVSNRTIIINNKEYTTSWNKNSEGIFFTVVMVPGGDERDTDVS